jgi:formamidopyrimidine-DNA glycosylase
MPELPEVETTCRGLSKALLGAKIARVEQNRADLRLPMPRNPSERLKGRSLHECRAIARSKAQEADRKTSARPFDFDLVEDILAR